MFNLQDQFCVPGVDTVLWDGQRFVDWNACFWDKSVHIPEGRETSGQHNWGNNIRRNLEQLAERSACWLPSDQSVLYNGLHTETASTQHTHTHKHTQTVMVLWTRECAFCCCGNDSLLASKGLKTTFMYGNPDKDWSNLFEILLEWARRRAYIAK